MRFILAALVALSCSLPATAQSVDGSCTPSFDGYPSVLTCPAGQSRPPACVDAAKQAYYAAVMVGPNSAGALRKKACEQWYDVSNMNTEIGLLEDYLSDLGDDLRIALFFCEDGNGSPLACDEADDILEEMDEVSQLISDLKSLRDAKQAQAEANDAAATAAVDAAAQTYRDAMAACCQGSAPAPAIAPRPFSLAAAVVGLHPASAPAVDVLPSCPLSTPQPFRPHCEGAYDMQCVVLCEIDYWTAIALNVDPIEAQYCPIRNTAERRKARMYEFQAQAQRARDRCNYEQTAEACALADALQAEYEAAQASYLAAWSAATSLLAQRTAAIAAAQADFAACVSACCDG